MINDDFVFRYNSQYIFLKAWIFVVFGISHVARNTLALTYVSVSIYSYSIQDNKFPINQISSIFGVLKYLKKQFVLASIDLAWVRDTTLKNTFLQLNIPIQYKLLRELWYSMHSSRNRRYFITLFSLFQAKNMWKDIMNIFFRPTIYNLKTTNSLDQYKTNIFIRSKLVLF